MRFSLGLLLGVLLGGAGVYAWLERPWHAWLAGDVAAAPDAGVETAAKEPPGGKRKRRRGRRPGAGAEPDSEIADMGEEFPTLSAADRALVWKGDAVSLPPRQLDPKN